MTKPKKWSFAERMKRVEKRTRGMSPEARSLHFIINAWAYAPKSVIRRVVNRRQRAQEQT